VKTIGRYHVERELAHGAMGAVYACRDPGAARRVAIKVITLPLNDESTARFQREARSLARLRHPGIVAVHELGEHGGLPFLVMDLVEGESLGERLKRGGPLSPERAVRLIEKVARAMAHAHAHGILHRDLKPDNLVLNGDSPVVTDFGLAVDLEAEADRLTRTGQTLGTPGFMAPEQANGDVRRMGIGTDIYGLGATLYALVTGDPPFAGLGAMAMLSATFEKAPPPPSAHADVSPELDAVVLRCLAKAPEDRYETAEALADDLAACLTQRSARKRLLGPVLAAVATLTLLGLVFAPSPSTSAPPSTPVTALVAPKLVVTAPAGQKTFKTYADSVRIVGQIAGSGPPVRVRAGTAETTVARGGSFTLDLPIPLGQSRVTVEVDGFPRLRVERRVRRLALPGWFAALEPADRAPLPLAEGLAFGERPREYVNTRDGSILVWAGAGLFMGKTEVTWGQYRAYCDDTGRRLPSRMRQPVGVTDSTPVSQVTWFDAWGYCHWAGLRLPSDAEWLYVATSGGTRVYPWGDAPPLGEQVNCRGVRGSVWDVGSEPSGASAAGCLDLLGNVMEWVDGTFEAPEQEPGNVNAARGGSCRTAVSALTERTPLWHANANNFIGFRVCRRAADPLPLAVPTIRWSARFFSSNTLLLAPKVPPQDRAELRALGNAAVPLPLSCLDLDFGMGPPAETLKELASAGLPKDHFAMIAEGRARLPKGRWTVRLVCDDGAEVTLDDDAKPLVSHWAWGPMALYTGSFVVDEPREVRLRVDYFELDGYARLLVDLHPTPSGD
jgi:predicted Ser/Thr protein kinase